MNRVHTLGNWRVSAFLVSTTKARMPFFRLFLLSLALIGALVTSACVGVTGKAVTGGPGGGGGSTSATLTPSSVNFGNVPVNANSSRSLVLTNTGATALTVTKIQWAGQGYSTAGGNLSVKKVVKAGSSLNFSVLFTPIAAGDAQGNLLITTTADNTPLAVNLDGTGVALSGGNPGIEATPSSVNFGNVTVGTTDTQTMRLGNTGTTELTITKISVSGTGFSASGLSIPHTLAPGKDTMFTASFKPNETGTHSGSIAISSNAGSSPLSISMTGSGVTTNARLSASTATVSFGTIKVGTTISQNVVLKNIGNINVQITSMVAVGVGFKATGGANVTLTPNQSTDVAITFNPKAPGGIIGTLTITSNAPTLQVALEGQGAGQVVPHTVTLSWTPSTSAVVGYNVYRGSVFGGPYTRINPSADSLTSFKDPSVLGGLEYFYVVSALDGRGLESGFSNQVSVTIPTP
jgi:HYDIN/CFA65/VesB family protein/centrosomal CEP192-like protein